MSDFLKYWDTRIDANESFFNKYPHIANFAFSECHALWDYMEEERNALLASHNALAEAIHKAMGRTADCDKKQTDDQLIADVAYLKRLASDYFKTSVGCGNRAFAAEQKYEALVEAVAWLREVDDTREWLMEFPWLRKWSGLDQCISEARAEVDRLIGGGE